MKQIQTQTKMRNQENDGVNTYAIAATRALEYGDKVHGIKICDLGIKTYYSALFRANKDNTEQKFQRRADIYLEIAKLYGIKGDKGLQDVCMRQSELALKDAMALANAKRGTD